MKIAIASMGNPFSVGTWSGIPAHISLALERKGHTIVPITLVRSKEPWHYNWLRRFYYRTQKKWFLGSVEEQWLKKISAQLDKAVNQVQPEVVLVIHADWLAYATFKQPACIIHDTTFATMIDYYPSFTKLTSRSLKLGNLMYQKALQRAGAAVFSATWASKSAIQDYDTSPAKVAAIPFGANINEAPKSEDVENWIEERTEADCCNLLFLGVDWVRKGGDDSLRFVAELNRIGIKSKLIIVGCSPVVPTELECFIERVGYLRKDVKADETKLTQILRKSQALLLPSLAECYGCVYCEANAYGLPALGRDTGGVSEIIKDGHNGLLLQAEESPEAFARRWANIWSNPAFYKQLSQQAYSEYTERLNYDAFADRLESILVKLVKNVKQEYTVI